MRQGMRQRLLKVWRNMRQHFTAILFFALACFAISVKAQQPTLKEAYDGCLLVGVALNASQFTEQNTEEAAVVKDQFNSISPENVLKWSVIHPQPDKYITCQMGCQRLLEKKPSDYIRV